MPLRTIAWPPMTEDNATPPNPLTVSEYRVYFNGEPTPTYVVPAPNVEQAHDFPFDSVNQVGVSAVGPAGEGNRGTVQHTESSGIPGTPGPITIT